MPRTPAPEERGADDLAVTFGHEALAEGERKFPVDQPVRPVHGDRQRMRRAQVRGAHRAQPHAIGGRMLELRGAGQDRLPGCDEQAVLFTTPAPSR